MTYRVDMPTFTNVLCSWLDEHGDDPRTFARDGHCDACGQTGHELAETDTTPDRLPERGSVEGPGDYAIPTDELDPPIYTWRVEDTLTSGTLTDYARDLERAHHADVSVSDVLWTVDTRDGRNPDELVMIRPDVHTTDYDENDYATVIVTVRDDENGDDVASYSIDGRA